MLLQSIQDQRSSGAIVFGMRKVVNVMKKNAQVCFGLCHGVGRVSEQVTRLTAAFHE